MTEQIRELDIQLGKELVRGVRAWDDLEKRWGSGIDIIDFRLAPQGEEWESTPNPFRSRTDLLRYFQRLSGDIRRETPDGEYLGAKADAFVTYLNYLNNPRSRSYVEGMTKIAGYYPRRIPGPEVNQAKQDINRDFSDRYQFSFDRQGWEAFHRQNGISPAQAAREIQLSEREIVDQVVEVVGTRSHPRTTATTVNLPEYWIGWVKATPDGSEFRINSNNVNRMRFYKGVPKRLTLHEEGGHAVMAQSFADNIREGLVNPGRGDTTVPGPEQWIQEGWASRLSRIYPRVLNHLAEEDRKSVELSVDLQYLTDIAYTNAQYELLYLERRREAVVEDLRDLLPHEPFDRIDLVIDAMTQRLDRMFYLPVYGDCSYYLKHNVESLPEDLKQSFADQIHKQPMIPDQVRSLVTRLTP